MSEEEFDLRPAPVHVRVAPLERRRTSEPIEVEGRFAASRAALLKSPSSGLLEGTNWALGDTVEEGQVLATVGAAMSRQRALATEAAIHAAQAQLAERTDNLEAAKARTEAPQRLAALEAKRVAMEHKLAHERVQARRHEILLGALEVRSPFRGRVSAVHVSPGASVMSGNALLEVVDVDPIVLVIEVPAYVARRVAIGERVRVRPKADAGFVEGVISRWSPTAADDVRRVLVDIDNAGSAIAAGERGIASLEVGEREACFAPRSALLHEKKGTSLRLVDHDRVRLKRVRTFGGDEWRVEVAGALSELSLVVLESDRPVTEATEVVIRGDH